VVAVLAVALHPGPREHPTTPAPPPGPGFAVPGASPAETCDHGPVHLVGDEQQAPALPVEPIPTSLTRLLGVLRRPAGKGDRRPPTTPAAWLPIADYDPSAVRLTSGGSVPMRIVPTSTLLSHPVECTGVNAHGVPGACLVGEAAQAEWACFSEDQIR